MALGVVVGLSCMVDEGTMVGVRNLQLRGDEWMSGGYVVDDSGLITTEHVRNSQS
jgi:hypothetical protein